MKTHIYRNRTRNAWSVRVSGRVQQHVERAALVDVEFRVQPSGWRRVVDSGQRNVHAYAAGRAYLTPEEVPFRVDVQPAFYNLSMGEFQLTRTGERIDRASFARFDRHGGLWVEV